ncbi:MAG TPA: RHS repeat-associated core domain-containing protein, partial [Gemmatimonadaceae bacterium]|nr:RHS repeat-associated core domain-containing protein [Gemmatimonadaceae bacterium]
MLIAGLVFARRAAAQSAPIIVTGVSASIGAYRGMDQERGWLVFGVKNTTAQSQSVHVQGDCGASRQYDDWSYDTDSDTWVDGGCSAINSTVTIAAGQTLAVSSAIGFDQFGFYDDQVTLTVYPVGNPGAAFAGVARVTYSASNEVLSATFLTSTTTTTYTPSVSPKTSSVSVSTSSSSAQTITVSNTGNTTANYALGVTCSGFVTTCGLNNTTSTNGSLTVNPAASATVIVSYSTGTSGSSGTARLTVTAPASSTGLIQADTSTVTVTPAAPSLAPVVTVTPGNGTVFTTSSTGQVRIDYCDHDDAIVQRTVTWQGQTLLDNFTSAPQSGCVTGGYSLYAGFALNPWQQNLAVTARDYAGHVTTATTTFTYSAPLANFRAKVTASSDWHRLSAQGSVTAADTFTIQNQGAYVVAYTVAPLCGGTATLTNCVSNKGSVSLAPGATDVAIVTYTRSGALDHPDTLKLVATYTSPLGGVIADSGKKVVIALSVEAAPAVSGMSGTQQLPTSSIITEYFTVTNSNAAPITFSLAATTTNGYLVNGSQGTTPPWTMTVPSHQSSTIPIGVGTPSATGITGTIALAVSYVTASGTTLSASAVNSMVTAASGSSGAAIIAVGPSTSRTLATGKTTPQRFGITNSGTQASINYRAVCSGAAILACTLDRSSALLGTGQSDSVNVNVSTTGSTGATGTVTFIAAGGTSADTAVVSVAIGATTGAVTISLAKQLNPGTSIARDECLTIAAGDDAVYECGDLRLVHALPTTTTLNKARTPTLIYTSAHAQPVALVQADVTIDGSSLGGACVSQIKATVRFTASDTSQRILSWNGACGQLATRRIAIAVDARAHTHPTGRYRYTLEVQALVQGLPTATDTTGVMVVVDRSASQFGPGWWLDGLEQLAPIPNHADSLLWIGGDGSTRLYVKVANDTFVVRPTLDRPDSLIALRTNGNISEYRRKLRNGAYVSFDAYFRHTSTVNTIGHTTRFVWHAPGSSQLDSVVLPVPSGGARRAYAFGYTSGLLSSVTAPTGPAGARVTTLTRNPSDLGIGDPGVAAVHYISDAGGRIIIRRSRLNDGTRFTYDPGASVLTRVALDMSRTSTAGDSISSTFCPAEAASVATCADTLVDPTAVRTLYDGPRLDVPDSTAFYLTRFGAPRLIVDALGHRTTIVRSDSLWPMLATKVIDARGHAVTAVYDASRAVLLSTVDANPNASSAGVTTGNAVTTYTWHPRWDRVTEIAAPMNLTTHVVYDATTGNRREQSVGSTHTNRTTFDYDPVTQLVASITTTQSATPTRLDYDGVGNLWHTTTPKGFVTTFSRDATGRDSLIKSPIDSLQTQFRTQIHLYDVNDRLTSSTDSALAGSVAQALRIVNEYDDDGHLKTVSRNTTPDTAHVGTIITDYTYDAAGRKATEHDRVDPENWVARWHYDQAGNVFQIDNKDSRIVTMRYDTLNHLSHRTIARIGNLYGSVDDVQDFSYDEVGNLVRATSPFAQVIRSYTLGGGLESDSSALHAADLTASGMAHGYRLMNHYDLAGRRISQDQPPNLLWIAAGSSAAGPSNSYGYDPETGALATVTDQRGNTFRYHYNSAGLLDSLWMPGAIVETHFYDDDSREVRRLEVGPMGTIHDDRSFRDAGGRALGVTVGGFASAGGGGNFTYAGLGPVMRSAIDLADFESIQFAADGFGHSVKKQQAGTESDPGTKLYQFAYESNSNRLSQVSGQLGTAGTDILNHGYDAVGNLTQQSYAQTTPMQFGEGGSFIHVDAWWSVLMGYDGVGRLLTTDRATVNDRTNWQNDTYHRRTQAAINTGYGSYEEYRYDALGRRIWKRTHRDSYCTNEARAQTIYQAECASAITVTVWDGDQVLYELRGAAGDNLTGSQLEHNIDSPIGSGTPFGQFAGVTYLHGAGIDRPLELIRIGEVLVFHSSWRGAVDASTNTLGQFSTCGLSTDGSCVNVRWPGQDMGLTYTRPYTARAAVAWYGDLPQGQLDASGKMYMRNRYYDPTTGRFTQEDPIGLAGGSNLYGFAGGDQVNYSDPFGLCPMCVGAATGVAEGFLIAKLTGQDYTWKDAALDATLGAVGAGLVSKLNRLRDTEEG